MSAVPIVSVLPVTLSLDVQNPAECREAMASITVERVLEAACAELDAADAKRRLMSA